MTLDELEAYPKAFLIPKDVAPILGCSPYTISLQAQQDPAKLGFPVSVMRSRVKIPRVAFIRWIRGELGKEETACETMFNPGS